MEILGEPFFLHVLLGEQFTAHLRVRGEQGGEPKLSLA